MEVASLNVHGKISHRAETEGIGQTKHTGYENHEGDMAEHTAHDNPQ